MYGDLHSSPAGGGWWSRWQKKLAVGSSDLNRNVAFRECVVFFGWCVMIVVGAISSMISSAPMSRG